MEVIQTIEKIREEMQLEQEIKQLAENIYENVISFIDRNTNDDGLIYQNAILKTKSNYNVEGNFLNNDIPERNIKINNNKDSESVYESVYIRKKSETENITCILAVLEYSEGEKILLDIEPSNSKISAHNNDYPHLIINVPIKYYINREGDIDEKIKKYIIDFFKKIEEETKTLVYDQKRTHSEENQNELVKRINLKNKYTELMHQYQVLPSVQKAAEYWSYLLISDDEQKKIFENEFERLCMEEFEKNKGAFPIYISTEIVFKGFEHIRKTSEILQKAMKKAKIDSFVWDWNVNNISMSIGIDTVKADKTIDFQLEKVPGILPAINTGYVESEIDWHMHESSEDEKRRGIK